MDEILQGRTARTRQRSKNLKNDFEEKHTVYAEKIVRRIIEG